MSFARNAFVAGAGLLLVLGGCSSSPKEELVESADAKCGELSARFADDLTFGPEFGMDDLAALDERVTLVEDLREQVRGMAAPESGRAELDDWLSQLDDVAEDMRTLSTDYRTATLGSDMALAMQTGIVDTSVDEVGRAARRFGLATCADVDGWKIFPKS